MTSTVEFARQEVALDGVDNWRDALQAIEAVIASVAMAPSDHSVLRLELTGETPLAWRLRRDHDCQRRTKTTALAGEKVPQFGLHSPERKYLRQA